MQLYYKSSIKMKYNLQPITQVVKEGCPFLALGVAAFRFILVQEISLLHALSAAQQKPASF